MSNLFRAGEIFAVKKMPRPGGRDNMDELMREVDTMRTLQHRHIVRYLGTEITPDFLYVFLEYVPGTCRLVPLCYVPVVPRTGALVCARP